jgi:hypothetical protein
MELDGATLHDPLLSLEMAPLSYKDKELRDSGLMLRDSNDGEVRSQEKALMAGCIIGWTGMVIFVTGYGMFGDPTGISLVIGQFLQTLGIFVVTTADVDINLYYKRYPITCIVFSSIYVAAFVACSVTLSVVFFLPATPLLFYVFPFRTWRMENHRYLYSHSGCLVLFFLPLATALFYFQQTVEWDNRNFLTGYYITEPSYVPVLNCAGWSAGTIFIVGASYWSKSNKESPTLQFFVVFYAFVLWSGLTQILFCVLRYHGVYYNGKRQPEVSTLEWAQGPLAVIPTLVAFSFHKSMYGFLGERWAKQRMADGMLRLSFDLKSPLCST